MTIAEVFAAIAKLTELADKIESANYDSGVNFAEQTEMLLDLAQQAEEIAETTKALAKALDQ